VSLPSLLPPGYFTAPVTQTDPLIAGAIASELKRQHDVIELIASENIVSRAVLDVQGSILTNKTVEGYPGKRYHAGAVNVDAIERAAIDRACQLFGCRFANVQPHSGSQANHAVLHAVAEPGDTILSMDLNAGGHLSHGAAVNFSGKWFKVVNYGVHASDGRYEFRLELPQGGALVIVLPPTVMTSNGSSTVDGRAPRVVVRSRRAKSPRAFGPS